MKRPFSLQLVWMNVRERLVKWCIWLLSICCVLVALSMLYPLLAQSALLALVNEVFQSFSEELFSTLGLTSLPQLQDSTLYFSLVLQLVMVLACIYACYLGASALVGNESNHNVVLLYSQPVSRTSIGISSYLANLVLLLALQGVLFGITLPICAAFGGEFTALMLLRVFGVFYLVELTYLSIGFVFSGFLTHANQAAGLALGVFLLSFVFGLLGKFTGLFGFLAYLAPYQYYSVMQLAEPFYHLNALVPVLMGCACLVLAGIGLWRYQRKDLYV